MNHQTPTVAAEGIEPARAGHLGISYPRVPSNLGPYSTLDERDPAHNGRPATGPHACAECGAPALVDERLCESCAWEAHRDEQLADAALRSLDESLFDHERDLRAEDHQ